MNHTGKKLLRAVGIFEVFYGVLTLFVIWWVLGAGKADLADAGIIPATLNDAVSKDVLWQLCFIYGCIAIQVIGGIVAFIFANKPKKYKVCMFFGLLLLVSGIASIVISGFSFLACFVQLIVPVIYIIGAMINKNNIA